MLYSCKTATDPKEKTDALLIEGTVDHWDQEAGSINRMGFFVDPIIAGTIESNGDFKMELPENFLELTKAAFAKANSQEGATYELIVPTAQETFPNTEGLHFMGAETPAALAGKYYGFEVLRNGTPVTFVFAASTASFIQHLLHPEEHLAEKGWFYYFIYVNKPVSIEGTTNFTSLFSNTSDESFESSWSYDLEMKPGWNIIKQEVTDLTTSEEAKYTADSGVKVSTVESLPSQINWISIPTLNLNL